LFLRLGLLTRHLDAYSLHPSSEKRILPHRVNGMSFHHLLLNDDVLLETFLAFAQLSDSVIAAVLGL
jgi:hypothetical protein